MLDTVAHLTVGKRAAFRDRRTQMHGSRDVPAAVRYLAGWDLPEEDDDPIFILSAGWRSGSTLLQRLLSEQGAALIWGEPYNRSCILQSCLNAIRPFAFGLHEPEALLDPSVTARELAVGDRENVYPSPTSLVVALRSYLQHMFLLPALAQGFEAWGLKEVRLGGEYVPFLKLLFPRARIIAVVRDPLGAWSSYRRYASWYAAWPDDQVRTVWAFCRHWNALAESLMDRAGTNEVLLVRYENILCGSAFLSLEDYLGLQINTYEALSFSRSTATQVPAVERAAIRVLTRSTVERLSFLSGLTSSGSASP